MRRSKIWPMPRKCGHYAIPTYADGFATSVYGVNPPMANALHPPGEFQVIDIIFRRPIYQGDRVVDPGYVTVFCNGVLVQDHTPIEGPTGHLARTSPRPFPEKGPLKLQDHGNPVRFRNIWYRALPPRSVEGGTDGVITADASAAKRREIAATLRAEAANLSSDFTAAMLRLAESLVYHRDPRVAEQVGQMAERYAATIKSLPGSELERRKSEILEVLRSFRYMAKWNLVPAGFGPLAVLDQIEKAQGWDDAKKKKKT